MKYVLGRLVKTAHFVVLAACGVIELRDCREENKPNSVVKIDQFSVLWKWHHLAKAVSATKESGFARFKK